MNNKVFSPAYQSMLQARYPSLGCCNLHGAAKHNLLFMVCISSIESFKRFGKPALLPAVLRGFQGVYCHKPSNQAPFCDGGYPELMDEGICLSALCVLDAQARLFGDFKADVLFHGFARPYTAPASGMLARGAPIGNRTKRRANAGPTGYTSQLFEISASSTTVYGNIPFRQAVEGASLAGRATSFAQV